MNEDDVRTIIRQELASLGGHLLAAYGTKGPSGFYIPLAALGGYLLQEYGSGEEEA